MEHDREHLLQLAAAGDASALTAAIAALRRRVAAGGAIDLGALAGLAAGAAQGTRSFTEPDMALCGLLDEIDMLVDELRRHQTALLEQLRAFNRHRQAGSAYDTRSTGR